jgi:hypothetical protein
MLSEKIYQRMSTEFGTPVGVANIIGYRKKTDHITEYSKESYKVLSDELDINYIITDVIEQNKYQEFQRILYNLKQNGNRRLKELTIYKRAYNILNGKKESNTKRRQVQI